MPQAGLLGAVLDIVRMLLGEGGCPRLPVPSASAGLRPAAFHPFTASRGSVLRAADGSHSVAPPLLPTVQAPASFSRPWPGWALCCRPG